MKSNTPTLPQFWGFHPFLQIPSGQLPFKQIFPGTWRLIGEGEVRCYLNFCYSHSALYAPVYPEAAVTKFYFTVVILNSQPKFSYWTCLTKPGNPFLLHKGCPVDSRKATDFACQGRVSTSHESLELVTKPASAHLTCYGNHIV